MGGSNPTKQLIRGTAVLALAAFLSKLLGVAYKIPYQNITGNLGFYVYEQVYPIYMILLMLATAGVPIAISKLVAERLALDDVAGARKVFAAAALLLSVTGVLFFCLLFFGAPVVARILHDDQLVLPIRSVAFALLVVPPMAVIRGYFQGHQNMVPTAVSQVVEQIVRVATIILLSYWLITHQFNEYYAGAGAVFGAFTGALAALVVLLIYWRQRRMGHIPSQPEEQTSSLSNQGEGTTNQSYQQVSYPAIIKKVISYAIPISLGSLVLPLFQLMDSLTIPRLLAFSGWETLAAQEARGIYARGHPLVQFASFFATALALALVPAISNAHAQQAQGLIVRQTQAALKFTVLVGLGAAFGLAILARPINIMIYITPEGTEALAVLAFVTLVSTLSITSGAVLQGMGRVTLPARHLFIGVGIKSILNVLLLPLLGIAGAAFASVVGYLTAALLNLNALRRMLPLTLISRMAWLKPLFSVFIMGAVVWLTKSLLFLGLEPLIAGERLLNLAVALLCIPVGVLVYGFLLLRLGALRREELELIPRIERFFPLLEKMKLMR